MAELKKSVDALVQLGVDTPIPQAEGANFFVFSATSFEVQMLMGAAGVTQLALALSKGEKSTRQPNISHHFILSTESFTRLWWAVNDLADQRPDLLVGPKAPKGSAKSKLAEKS